MPTKTSVQAAAAAASVQSLTKHRKKQLLRLHIVNTLYLKKILISSVKHLNDHLKKKKKNFNQK